VGRSEASPNRTNFDKRSCLMERTQRSAKAFKFGLRGEQNWLNSARLKRSSKGTAELGVAIV